MRTKAETEIMFGGSFGELTRLQGAAVIHNGQAFTLGLALVL